MSSLRSRSIGGVLFVVLFAFPWSGAAQDASDATATFGKHKNSVAVGASFDPALTVDLNYTRRFSLDFGSFERDLATSLSWSVIPGFTNWDLEAAGAVRIWDRAGFDILTRAGLTLKRLSNAVHKGVGYGYQIGVFPGYYGQKWYLAGEVSARHVFAMSVSHTDAYREAFPDAQDGTYALGGLSTYFGAGAGAQIGDHVLLGLRFAWRFQNLFEAYLPYYQPSTFSLQAGYRF